ncbi:MAG: hypothetical protein AB1467_06960 [Candidatus Diapherotrites archaeon]
MERALEGSHPIIKHDGYTGKYYKKTTRKDLLQSLGNRTKVTKVYDEEGYRESATLRRFNKPHGVNGGDKPIKIVTKLYGEKGKFRDKRVIKPQVPAKKMKKEIE